MTAQDELRHLGGEADADPVPPGFELDELTFPGAAEELARAREVMSAVLGGNPLPRWFAARCVDDSAVQTCTLDRWSLRAWRFWLSAENRRWWWWSAETVAGEIHFRALVRARPYLRGSLDWLFFASRADAG